MANFWDNDTEVKTSPFDAALKAEGVTGQIADIARSIYQQESGSGKNTKTSNAGAVGGMQIIPATFSRMADKGWAIDDPTYNARAGIRYIKTLYDKAGGDPALTAAGYYGGEGAIPKAKAGIAVSDPRNPNAPNTLQYGQQVAARIPTQTTQAPVSASNFWENDVEVKQPTKPVAPTQPETSKASKVWQGITDLSYGYDKIKDRAAAGLGRGLKDVVDTGADYLSKLGGAEENQRVQAMNAAGKADYEKNYGDSNVAGGFRLGGNILATAPVGGALGGAAQVAKLPNALVNALRSGGMSGGGNLATRVGAGATVGGASTALVSPEDVGYGVGIGGALPIVGKVAGVAGNALGSVVRPFFKSGQEKIAGNVLRDFAENPLAARTQLANSGEIVAGSMPTTAMSAGDNGIAALSRAMQNADPRFAAELATRQTAQNQARTTALENIAGNTGKIDIAKSARDAATDPMRESVLMAAGRVPTESIIGKLDNLIANPNNAGKLSQQALNEYKASIAKASQDGTIDARALYEIRKDINTTLQGKLQGDAGNLRYASTQLKNVKGLIDDAIDMASKKVQGTGTEVMPYGANISTGTIPNPVGSQAPRASWSDYLKRYTNESIPIGQMEKLDTILKQAQTGTVDAQGGLILSGAKLNNILKNEGDALRQSLSPEQLDVLRRVSADLNAGQIANNTGRAVGSNTLQNMAQNQILTSALGKTIGGSSPATATIGRLLQLPYGTANKQIQERLGNALLDPKEAARLMADPKTNMLLQRLMGGGSKAIPAIASQ